MQCVVFFLLLMSSLLGMDSFSCNEVAGFTIRRNDPKTTSAEPVNPILKRCPGANDCFATVDFLFWQAGEDGLDYAQKLDVITRTNIRSEYIQMDYGWDPGVRLGFGWKTPYNGWDLFFNWTWYGNTTKNHQAVSSVSNEEGGLVFLWSSQLADNLLLVQSIKSSWHLNQNLFDLSLCRSFYVGDGFCFRPLIGIRAGWFDRAFSVNSDSAFLFDFINYSAKFKEWGIGPRLGMNSFWFLPYGFHLFGDLSFAFFYGTEKGSSLLKLEQDITPPVQQTVCFNDTRLLTNLQAILGFGWGTCLRKETMLLNMKLGWEVMQWFELTPFSHALSSYSVTEPSSPTNLNIKGLTFSTELDF